MRHRNAGYKLQRNTSHRRALLRNLATSLITEERIETTVTKAKALRPTVEKLITLGKRGTEHARKQAASYLMTKTSVEKLFTVVGPRFSERPGGYTRIVLTGFRSGDGGAKAIIELLGNEKFLSARKSKRETVKAKKADALKKQMEEEGASETDEKK